MANHKICKVCGKEYEPCRSLRQKSSVFNWRAVACSPQCGQEYFRLIAESRGETFEQESAPQQFRAVEPECVETDDAFDESAEIETFFY